MVCWKWYAQTTARSMTQWSLLNLPKSGNLNLLPEALSMLNPMEKLNELFKQQRTCCRRMMTLWKPCLHTHPHPYITGWQEPIWVTLWLPDPMRPSLPSRISPNELASNRGLEGRKMKGRWSRKVLLQCMAQSQGVTRTSTRWSAWSPVDPTEDENKPAIVRVQQLDQPCSYVSEVSGGIL